MHGQLRDLLLLFAYFGAPTHKGGDVQVMIPLPLPSRSPPAPLQVVVPLPRRVALLLLQTTSYVFNGDWVDRGAHQLEVVALCSSRVEDELAVPHHTACSAMVLAGRGSRETRMPHAP